MSVNDIDKLEERKITKKKKFSKNAWYNWYDWLVNYIPEPIKTMNDAKETKLRKH